MTGSYKPLYRKYRPQAFHDLIGQDAISKTLSNALTLGRVAHAYLFTGPRGTGKTSSARIFAKSLNCIEGPTVTPCEKCASCIDITNSNSIDVIEIDAASNRKVEDARNLLEKVQFVPTAGKFKIYIIDEVHMLTTEAFNTLLKTLEEPPKNLVFILATTEAHKVLNTIISRCQRFDFRRVPQDLIIKRLKELAKTEDININDKALALIAKRAYGGMRDALGLLDQSSVLSAHGEEITENEILTLLGSLSEDILFDMAKTLAQKDTAELIDLIDKVVQSCEPVNVIRELINYFRNILILKTSDNLEKVKPLLDFTENMLPEMKTQSNQFELHEIVQIIEKLSEYEKTIKTTSQQHIWLEVALISICHRQDIHVIKDLEQRLEKLESAVATGNVSEIAYKPVEIRKEIPRPTPAPLPVREVQPAIPQEPIAKPAEAVVPQQVSEKPAAVAVAQKPSPEPMPAPKTPAVTNISGDTIENWKAILNNIESLPSRMFFLNLAKPIEISAKKVIVTFQNEIFVKQSRENGKIVPLQKASEMHFGTLPDIILRTPMPEDKDLVHASVVLPKEEPKPKIEPFEPKPTSQIAIDVEPEQRIEPEVLEQLDDINKNVVPVNIEEQAKMVIELFNGKVIE